MSQNPLRRNETSVHRGTPIIDRRRLLKFGGLALGAVATGTGATTFILDMRHATPASASSISGNLKFLSYPNTGGVGSIASPTLLASSRPGNAIAGYQRDNFTASFDGNVALPGMKEKNVASALMSLQILSASSNYHSFTLQTTIPITVADAPDFWFATGVDADILAVKESGTASGFVEVYVISAASGYQQISLQAVTPLAENDVTANFQGMCKAPNGDLIGVKCFNTGSGFVEVHKLSAASQYRSFSLHAITPISEGDYAQGQYAFATIDEDLVCVKRSKTGTGYMEVHILSAASGYKTFTLHTPTPITDTDSTDNYYQFVTINQDLVCVKTLNTGTGNTEVHILSGASNYHTFILHTPTPIPELGKGIFFSCADANG